ncbi:MAG: SidA/IucD/PvdA family monooxygenase [Moraxellaceae bacterium]|nr:SidA/IucD/PvdA family monooxygenase [Moraxellaceae bacterium]
MKMAERSRVGGVGFGPANIALAIALKEYGLLSESRFFEKNRKSTWQAGMLLESSDIQNHPLRDLVTPRNPCSYFSFTNFLHVKGRLFEYLNMGMTFPFRIEYEQYVSWAASHFRPHVQYGEEIMAIRPLFEGGDGVISGFGISDGAGQEHFCSHLVVAPGRTRYVPDDFLPCLSERVVHLCDYLPTVEALASRPPRVIAVIGGSQSAVELMVDLSERFPDAEIHGIHRAYGFRQKDVSPFTGEVYFPEFVDEFYAASQPSKEGMRADLHYTNYSASDIDVLDVLYRRIYLQKIRGQQNIFIHRRSAVAPTGVDVSGALQLSVKSMDNDKTQQLRADLVVLATGFKDIGSGAMKEECPAILRGLYPYLKKSELGVIQVNRDYSLVFADEHRGSGRCFLNGLCESTHGMGDAGSFSLLSLRADDIINSIRMDEERCDLSVSREVNVA